MEAAKANLDGDAPDYEALLRQRLADVIVRAGGATKVSDGTGIPKGTLEKYLAKTSTASLANAAKISYFAGVSIDSFAADHTRRPSPEALSRLMSAVSNMEASRRGQPDVDMVTVPRYDEVRPSAGYGSLAINELTTTRIAFEPNWLAELGVRPESAVILPAQGDSMEPTIMNGAPMLVDTSKKEVRNGFIYVFDVAGDLMVKRIERLPDGTINLLSDNSERYPARTLDLESVARMTVIGRVYAAVSKF